MEEETKMADMPLCWSLDPKEDHLSDQEVNIFDPFLSITNLNSLKEHLLEESKLGKDGSHLCKFGLVHFCFR